MRWHLVQHRLKQPYHSVVPPHWTVSFSFAILEREWPNTFLYWISIFTNSSAHKQVRPGLAIETGKCSHYLQERSVEEERFLNSPAYNPREKFAPKPVLYVLMRLIHDQGRRPAFREKLRTHLVSIFFYFLGIRWYWKTGVTFFFCNFLS